MDKIESEITEALESVTPTQATVAAGLTVASALILRNARAPKPKATMTGTLTGVRKPSAKPTAAFDAATHQGSDNTAILGNTLRRSGAEQAADDIDQAVSTAVRSAGVRRTLEMARTGDYGHGIKSVPMDDHLKRLQALDPQDTKLLDEMLTVGDAGDDVRIALKAATKSGTSPHDVLKQTFRPGTGAETGGAILKRERDLRRQLANLPIERASRLRQLKNEYHKITDDLLKYSLREGLLDANTVKGLQTDRLNYVHHVVAEEAEGGIANLLKWQLPKHEADNMADITEGLFKQRAGQSGPIADAYTGLDTYIATITRAANHNRIRRDYIDAMLQAQRTNPSAGAIIQRVGKKTPQQDIDRYGIEILRRGQREQYLVRDKYAHDALKFSPHSVYNFATGANTLRRFFQQMTTGLGAPLQAVRAFQLDVATGAANVRQFDPGAKIGPIDALLAKATRDLIRVGSVPGQNAISGAVSDVLDPGLRLVDSMLGGITGVGRGIASQFMREVSTSLAYIIAKDGTLVNLIGKQGTQAVADRLTRAYMRSSYHILQRYGGVSGRFQVDDWNDNMMSMFREMQPSHKLAQLKLRGEKRSQLDKVGTIASTVFRMYRGTIASVHNGARIAHMSYNKDLAKMSAKDMERLAFHAREAFIDFDKAGSSSLMAGVRSSVPYGHISVRAVGNLFHMARKNPALFVKGMMFTTALPMATGAVYASLLGPQYRDYYWNKAHPAQRWGMTYIPIAGEPPEDGIWIPMVPEFALLAGGPFIEAMDAVFGLSGMNDVPMQPDLREGLLDAFGIGTDFSTARAVEGFAETADRVVGLSAPPLVNAGLAAIGMSDTGVNPGALVTPSRDVFDLRAVYGNRLETGEERPNTDIILTKNVRGVIEALGGLTGGMAMQMVESVHNAVNEEGTPMGEAIKESGQIMRRQSVKSVPGAAQLLDIAQPLSVTTVDSMQVRAKMNGLEKLANLAADQRRGGLSNLTGRTRQILEGKVRKPVSDGQAAMVLKTVANWYNKQGRQLKQRGADLRTALDSKRASGRAPDTIVEGSKDTIREIHAADADQLRQIEILEKNISAMIGANIKIEDLGIVDGVLTK